MSDDRGSLARWGPLVVGLVVVVASGAAGAVLLGPPSGEAVLDDVEQRYGSAETVVGSATVVAESGNASVTRSATVEFVAAEGNKSRLTVTEGNRTVVVGTNGSIAWSYQPATGLVQVTEDARDRLGRTRDRYGAEIDRFERFEENLTAVRTGSETVAGAETHILELRATNGSATVTGQLWVDKTDSTVRKLRTAGENGTVTVTFDDQRLDASVHPSTFRPPNADGRTLPGAERESYDAFDAAQAATDLRIPDLRGAYGFEEAVVAAYDGTETATVTYATDAGTVYVTVGTDSASGGPSRFGADAGEQRTVAGQPVRVVETSRGSAVYWTDGQRTTAVLTRGPPGTAVDTAEAILDG
jgi:outer membrane lipoprotein-sorting protein